MLRSENEYVLSKDGYVMGSWMRNLMRNDNEYVMRGMDECG